MTSTPLMSMYVIYIFVAVMINLIINVALVVVVYRDAKKRRMDPILWLVVVLFLGLLGVLFYLVKRGSPKRP